MALYLGNRFLWALMVREPVNIYTGYNYSAFAQWQRVRNDLPQLPVIICHANAQRETERGNIHVKYEKARKGGLWAAFATKESFDLDLHVWGLKLSPQDGEVGKYMYIYQLLVKTHDKVASRSHGKWPLPHPSVFVCLWKVRNITRPFQNVLFI